LITNKWFTEFKLIVFFYWSLYLVELITINKEDKNFWFFDSVAALILMNGYIEEHLK
jgi:hypothetical protein